MNRNLLLAALCAALFVAPTARATDSASAQKTGVSPWTALARGRVEPAGGIIQIAAPRDGIVKALLVSEADHVVQGQALASLRTADSELAVALAAKELDQARAALALLQLRAQAAHRDAERLAPLVAEQLANASDLDQAREHDEQAGAELAQGRAACETAQARLDIARHELDERTLHAPVAGRILRCLVKPGEGVSTQSVTPLFWLAPDGPLAVRAQLDESSAGSVAPGQLAEIVPDSSGEPVAVAKVVSVGLFFGPKRPATDDPSERQDLRVADCLLSIEKAPAGLLIGQRVVVRFLRNPAK